MCYPCLNTCENCKQKYLYCPACGSRNFVMRGSCMKCGLEFTEEMREDEYRAWLVRTNKVLDGVVMPDPPQGKDSK